MQLKYLYITFIFSISLNAHGNIYEIKTTSGITNGHLKNNVIYWDDIPYAEPPIGDLRWKAPRKLDASARDNTITSKNNNFCIQEPSGLGGSDDESFISGSEDCLYLDIKSPKNLTNELLPVMFWIHGGGNTTGLKDHYDFSTLAKKHKVIVVSINYRLGPFGWFTHPSIQDLQNGMDRSSNFGTLDILAALEWVQNNISNFGGDSNNVTIFGESAGGHNVLSLLVSRQANGLFHKAISQSGYTTTYSKEDAYKSKKNSSISEHTSWSIVNKILRDKSSEMIQEEKKLEIRDLLKNLTAKEFFKYYTDRASYENIPLLTADEIVIPKIGLAAALSKEEYSKKIPVIAGSNRDEVKLWLASAKYFVSLDYSFLGSIFGLPKVTIKDKKAFDLFNSYRSKAWKIRGVDSPLKNLHQSGNTELYAYRYDWDDHRTHFVADFKKLVGAAHATEIPLLTGNNKLVEGYGFLLYPRGPSKRFTSMNMMHFWTNFARNGKPGQSSNGVEWKKYNGIRGMPSSFIILDNKKNLKMQKDNFSFSSLLQDLSREDALTDIEKCVILFQMLTYVGDDIYDNYISDYPGSCSRAKSEQFLKDNDEFIDY